MSTAQTQSEYSFQAEIKQLLNLLAHSLYQNKEIAIRELVSNASDALDKMRYVSLTDPPHRDVGPLEIRLERDKDANVLSIIDTGVGMTRDELVQNLGTIAHSGSMEFLKSLSGDSKKDVSLIGQFGVGFYSSFMLAEQVQVVTRSYKEEQGWRWESEGTGTFTITPADVPERGTTIILKLREETKEFVDEHRLKTVLRKYSTFVPHPIKLDGEQVNAVKPIWVEPRSQVTHEQYVGFYQHLTHRSQEEPMWLLHFSADSPIQFQAILYSPPTNTERLGFGRLEHGLHLCAKRILVDNNCKELLPDYFRFAYGLVDSEDLPLNVSRDSLQDNTIFRKIRATVVEKLFDRLDELAKSEPERYLQFFREFGGMLKEGACTDFEHRHRISPLLRFVSALKEDDQYISLDEYVEQMPAGQEQIYFLGGPDLASIRSNPNLEIFRKRNLEVLLMPEPIDEFVVTSLHQYKDKKFVSIDSADLKLPGDEESSDAEQVAGFGRVVELFQSALSEKVSEVRASKRLTESACCLVTPEGDASVELQRLMRLTNKDFKEGKKILELNPRSPLIERLCLISANPEHVEFLRKCALLIYDTARLVEGNPPDPKQMVERIQDLMRESAESRSPIIR